MLEIMPERVRDARQLSNLTGDEAHAFLRQAADIDSDVQLGRAGPLGAYAARDEVEVLKQARMRGSALGSSSVTTRKHRDRICGSSDPGFVIGVIPHRDSHHTERTQAPAFGESRAANEFNVGDEVSHEAREVCRVR
jgi:hypothetical protein